MKKLLLIPIAMLLGLFIVSCEDSTTDPGGTTTGTLFVQSTPAGAQIWVDGSNTGKVTPDSIKNLSAVNHALTLKLDGYRDSIQTNISITAGQTVSKSITLTSNLSLFGPVQIWETTGSNTTTEPSGLILKNGTASFLVSAAPNRLLVDLIFYSSSSIFDLRSVHLYGSGLTRRTYFKAGTSNNLNDGGNAPTKDGTWIDQLPNLSYEDSSKYYFVYDQDQHYSKIRVVDSGGGNPQVPAWTKLQWIYNTQVDDTRF